MQGVAHQNQFVRQTGLFFEGVECPHQGGEVFARGKGAYRQKVGTPQGPAASGGMGLVHGQGPKRPLRRVVGHGDGTVCHAVGGPKVVLGGPAYGEEVVRLGHAGTVDPPVVRSQHAGQVLGTVYKAEVVHGAHLGNSGTKRQHAVGGPINVGANPTQSRRDRQPVPQVPKRPVPGRGRNHMNRGGLQEIPLSGGRPVHQNVPIDFRMCGYHAFQQGTGVPAGSVQSGGQEPPAVDSNA